MNTWINKRLFFENKNIEELTDLDEILFMRHIKDKILNLKYQIEREPKGEIHAFLNGIIMTQGFSSDLEYEIRMLLNI